MECRDCKAFIELLDGFDLIDISSDDVNEATSEASDYKGWRYNL